MPQSQNKGKVVRFVITSITCDLGLESCIVDPQSCTQSVTEHMCSAPVGTCRIRRQPILVNITNNKTMTLPLATRSRDLACWP